MASETPPEMERLLPRLPTEPVVEEYADRTPHGASSTVTLETKSPDNRECFVSPPPPPFPFSLSYSSKSESSSGEKAAGPTVAVTASRNNVVGTVTGVTATIPGASPTVSNSEPSSAESKAVAKRDEESPVAKHPGHAAGFMENDPRSDPMFTSLFNNEEQGLKKRKFSSSPESGSEVGLKAVTEEETSLPERATAHRGRGTTETPPRDSQYHHSPQYFCGSPNQPYYTYPTGQYQSTNQGVEEYHLGHNPFYSYQDSRHRDEGGAYATYPYYQDYSAGYSYDGYVGNHPEQYYYYPPQDDAIDVDKSPGQVSYASSSRSQGGYQSPNPSSDPSNRSTARLTRTKEESPYKSMPPIRPGSPPPFKKLKTLSSAWSERFDELVDYKRIHGDCNVPQKYPANASLGIWVNKQRMEYKLFQEGKKSSMNLDRIQRLEDAGFVWAKRKGPEAWETKFNELVAYKEEHGDCLVPTKYSKNKALGRWVSTQRAQYKLWEEGNRKCTLTDDRKKRLEKIGFVWRLQF